MYDAHDLGVLLNSASCPLLFCNTSDEPRVLALLCTTALRLNKAAWKWTCVEGLSRIEVESAAQASLAEPQKLLSHIRRLSTPGVFALLDFHHYLDEPKHVRLLKEIALDAEQLGHTIVFVSHEISIPKELLAFSREYTFQTPSQKEIARIIHEELQRYLATHPGKKVVADKESLDALITSLRGMPEIDVRRLAHNAIVDDAALTHSDIAAVVQAKKQLLQKNGVLEFDFDTASMDEVAGLVNLKTWLAQRKAAIHHGVSDSAFPLDPPKGVLLLGIQGCGKSLAAKAIAGSWHLPLLRLDMGAIFNKYMGETERRIRDALQSANTLAPCIVWIDELEKGIASTDFDGGTAQRVLGTLLTWMAERKEFVFVVATANNIDALPAELLRKGRFDEIFFVDLPTRSIREELFKIHLSKRGLALSTFDLSRLSEVTEGFSGAEIEQLVVSAMYGAIAQSGSSRDLSFLNTDSLCEEASRTRPLSVVMAEQIQKTRTWAKERCVFADQE